MDAFKEQQMKSVGIGGLTCSCCNDYFGKNKRKLNREARARLKKPSLLDYDFIDGCPHKLSELINLTQSDDI